MLDLDTCPTSPNSVPDPHSNGHLVSSGMYGKDSVQALFIHQSGVATRKHWRAVYYYNVYKQKIVGPLSETSTEFNIEEHGWFRDLAIIKEICKNHPIPNGSDPQEIFIDWRASLLNFLDTNHSGGLWTRID
jgi:hypothetical protein